MSQVLYIEYDQSSKVVTAVVDANPKSPYLSTDRTTVDSMNGMPGWYKVVDNKLVLDQQVKAEQLAQNKRAEAMNACIKKTSDPINIRRLAKLILMATKDSQSESVIALRQEIMDDIGMDDLDSTNLFTGG